MAISAWLSCKVSIFCLFRRNKFAHFFPLFNVTFYPLKSILTQLKGRPKGSKNKGKTESTSTSYQAFKTLLDLVQSQLKVFLPELNCFHLVLDGFYGHEDYLLLAAKHGLNIISKFKTNAHLILPYQGNQLGIGRPKTLGDKVNLDNLVSTIQDKDSNVSTKVYQFEAFTPKMAGLKLNIVVMLHTHQITKRVSRNILFTHDLTLEALKVIKYYSLRFQIEFDFRDAKQFYGLSHFKNYKQTQRGRPCGDQYRQYCFHYDCCWQAGVRKVQD